MTMSDTYDTPDTRDMLDRVDALLNTANTRLTETSDLFQNVIAQTSNRLEDRIGHSGETVTAMMSTSVENARLRLEEAATLFHSLVQDVTAGVERLPSV